VPFLITYRNVPQQLTLNMGKLISPQDNVVELWRLYTSWSPESCKQPCPCCWWPEQLQSIGVSSYRSGCPKRKNLICSLSWMHNRKADHCSSTNYVDRACSICWSALTYRLHNSRRSEHRRDSGSHCLGMRGRTVWPLEAVRARHPSPY